MSIGPPIPEILHFQNLTLKTQGRGHSSRSQSRHNALSTHIPFVPCCSALPFLGYSYFEIWPWKSKVKVIAQGHKVGITPYTLISLSFHFDRPSHSWVTTFKKKMTLKIKGQGHGWGHSSKSQCGSNILSTHIPFAICQSALPFLRYSSFKIWPWKSKFKVIAEGHKVGIIPYRLISLSFRVDRSSHSWDTAFSKFDLENLGSRSIDDAVAQLQVETIP